MKGLPKIDTKDQAMRYAFERLDRLHEARINCNVVVPGDKVATMQAQKKAFRKYLMTLGAALEACSVLHSVGFLEDAQFSEIYDKAMCTMLADTVGTL